MMSPKKQDVKRMMHRFVQLEIQLVPAIFISGGLSFLLAMTHAWWLSVVCGGIGGYLATNPRKGFLTGCLGLLLGWGTQIMLVALFDQINRLNEVLSMLGINAGIVALLTIAIGSILGGFGGLNAALLKKGIKSMAWYKSSSEPVEVPTR
ncbi:hypothetical protein GF325_17900 [Candidatus Bathyarchaeota archaeon]|nr:hypothetical protein [Candidatus Bathyarchaeota archaeon]